MKRSIEIFEQTENTDTLSEDDLKLLFMIPLIQTAWVCGAVSPREKRRIFDAAREDGIDARHRLNDTIDEFLMYQPSQRFFEHCIGLINEHLTRLTVTERNAIKSKLMTRCNAVAASAGSNSLMDVDHRISAEEHHLLTRLKEVLC